MQINFAQNIHRTKSITTSTRFPTVVLYLAAEVQDRFHPLPRRAQPLPEGAPQVNLASAGELAGSVVGHRHEGEVRMRNVGRYQRAYAFKRQCGARKRKTVGEEEGAALGRGVGPRGGAALDASP